MKQPEFHASKPIVVQVPVHPILLDSKPLKTIFKWRKKCPQWKTLPQGYFHHLCGQSLSGMTPLLAQPQQKSPPNQLGLAWTGRLYWWLLAKLDATPSSPESLCPSNGPPQIRSLRKCQGSQTESGSPLEATLRPPEIKCGVLHELGTVLTLKQLAKASTRTYGPPCRDTTVGFGPVESKTFPRTVDSSVVLVLKRLNNATHTAKCASLPRPHHYLNLSAAFFKIGAALSMRLYPVEHTREDAGYNAFKMID